MTNKINITFILPTYNREDFVCRAIDSCLNISQKSKNIETTVLVLDGYSTDQSWKILNTKYSDCHNVILKQVSKDLGFQETAFLGVSMVKTEYVTFMYNDDILSDYYFDFVEKMAKSNQNFIVGYGSNFDVNFKYDFKPPEYINVHSDKVILNYFGHYNFLEYSYLPVSPINTISTTALMKDWVKEVREFCDVSSFRKYLMIKQNVGPDLILFLFNLYKLKKEFLMCNSTISQLSFHDDSMSIGYGEIPLKNGYWLSRIWLFEKECTNEYNSKKYLSKLSGYIVLSGLYVALINLRSGHFKNFVYSMHEILKILYCSLQKNFFTLTLFYFVVVFYNVITCNKKKLTPN